MLGLSFDDNGKYIGWSTLFKYSSEEALRASEYLPAPQKTIYNKIEIGYDLVSYQNLIKEQTNIINEANKILQWDPNNSDAKTQLYEAQTKLNISGLDLNPYILQIQQAQNDVGIINGYVNVLNAINSIISNKRANIYYTIPNSNEIVQKLREHEFTKLPTKSLQDANKNFIASHIQNVIQDLENMIAAYQPVEMEDLRDASDLSPKGQQSSQMTLLNPSTKLLMQYANVTGKNVVGVAANGIKGSFMWYYYINDIIQHPERSNFEKKLNYALFNFTTTRLIGRSSNNLQETTINTLSDINLSNVPQEILDRLGYKLTSLISVDNSGSQLVSAATDNAKELILAKINSGNKLAKIYSFLISLGVDLNDIVSFMTSDVVSFIDAVTETDIFNNYDVSIKDAIQIAKTGNVPRKYNTHKDKIIALYQEYKLDDISKIDEKNADVNEFYNILEAADEFSNFARLLGLNQGIPVTKVEIQNVLSFIQSIFNNRLNEYKADNPSQEWVNDIEPFDVYKWMNDEKYREEISEIYNNIKKCINVFDIFNSIPQFDAIRQIFSAVLYVDPAISIKSKAYNKLYDAAKKKNIFMPEDYQQRLLAGIDNDIISDFILHQHIKLPVKQGTRRLDSLFAFSTFNKDGEFKLKTKEDLAIFKYIFESTIIPLLKEGKTWKYVNGQIYEMEDLEIKSNPFIKALRIVRKNDLSYYTVDLNMLTIENSTNSQQKFQRYSTGLQKLSTKYFGNETISNWFILYNLIINKNAYGADKLTTLFDTFLKSKTNVGLLNDYFEYVSKLDYESDISLDIENDLNSKNLIIGFEDSLISAAPIVRSQIGRKEPYILINRGDGLILMRRDKGQYEEVGPILNRQKNETPDQYLERVNNFTNYYTFGKNFSGELSKQINEIIKLGENTISILNDFIVRGILSPIQKICQ